MVNYVLLSHRFLQKPTPYYHDCVKDICLKNWVETGPVLSCLPQDANFYPYTLVGTETEMKQVTSIVQEKIKKTLSIF